MKKRADFGHKTPHMNRKGRGLRVVELRYVPTPDANLRLSRTIDILLRSATSGSSQAKESPDTEREEPPRQAPAKDTLAGGTEEDSPCEE